MAILSVVEDSKDIVEKYISIVVVKMAIIYLRTEIHHMDPPICGFLQIGGRSARRG